MLGWKIDEKGNVAAREDGITIERGPHGLTCRIPGEMTTPAPFIIPRWVVEVLTRDDDDDA